MFLDYDTPSSLDSSVARSSEDELAFEIFWYWPDSYIHSEVYLCGDVNSANTLIATSHINIFNPFVCSLS